MGSLQATYNIQQEENQHIVMNLLLSWKLTVHISK